MRHIEPKACLENAQALGHPHLAVGVGHRDHSAPTLKQCANAARHEHQHDRRAIKNREIKHRDLLDRRALRERHNFDVFGAPLRLRYALGHLVGAAMGARHCQRRQQYGYREQERRGPFEKRFQTQPKIQADAGVRPGHRQKQKLHTDHVRPVDPISQQRRGINRRIASIQQASKPHDPEMACDQQRNAQPEHELGDFNDRVAKMPPLIERPQSQQEMRRCSGIECKIDDRDPPPPDVKAKPRFHGVV